MSENDQKNDPFLELTKQAIAKYREKLLDLSNRNNFINLSLQPRSNRNIRIIDELPNRIYEQLENGDVFSLISLPQPEDDPADEQNKEFLSELEYEKLNNDEYIKTIDEMGEEFDEANQKSQEIIRKLKDDLRDRLGMPKRISPDTISIEEYAKTCGITPNYEVPLDQSSELEEKHQDKNLQTLFYPNDLERKCRLLNKEYQKFINEKGTNTLYISFGCLEWYEFNDKKRISPLLLYPVTLTENKSKKGRVHVIESSQSELEVNLSLTKRLQKDFGIDLPPLSDELNNPEDYFKEVNENLVKNKEKWKVRRYINLTIHSYSKISMYDDLDPEKWDKKGLTLGDQKGIRDLFTGSEEESGTPREHDLDERSIIEKVPVLIDNADSSQYSTIIDALDGRSLVVQGPPGTGKSTTIANMLASFLHENKKVLFMSEKKAALDVVYKKLKDKDLDPFVFKLSATTESKTEFISEIKNRIETDKKDVKKEDLNIIDDSYHQQINKIKKYKDFLKTKYFDLEISGYKILVNFAKAKYKTKDLENTFEELIPFEGIENINSKKLYEIYGSLDDLEKIYKELLNEKGSIIDHPWYGLSIKDNNPFEIEKTINQLKSIRNDITEIERLIKDFNLLSSGSINLNIKNNEYLKALSHSEKIDLENQFISNIHEPEVIEELKEFYNKISKYSDFKKAKNNLSGNFDLKENLTIENIERYSRFIQNSNFFSFLFDSNYKEAKTFYKRIKLDGKFNKENSIKDLSDLKRYLESLPSIKELENDLDNNFNDIQSILKNSFNLKETLIDELKPLNQILNYPELSNEQLIYLFKNNDNISTLKNLSLKLNQLNYSIKDGLDKILSSINLNDFFTNYEDLEIIKNKLDNINFDDKKSLNNFIQFNYYKNNLHPLITIILTSFIHTNTNFENVQKSFDYVLYKSIAQKLFDKDENIQELNVINFEEEISKFKKIDQVIFELKKDNLINTLLGISPTIGVSRGKASDLTEYSLIQREISKQRAHISYRQLLNRAGQAMRDIKPCFMLSPISLSQISDVGSDMFDVLVIDEASQMRIEDAIGGIVRSKQIIVVGDPEQLPPSNFFDSSMAIDDDGLVDDDESILDLAIAKFKPKRMLKWHYRSNHESLINFSNKFFYNESLIIPPSANDKFAINHNKVQGTYVSRSKNLENTSSATGGTNEIECKQISQAVVDFMKNNSNKSCLVVTMNNVQRDLIDEQIRLYSNSESAVEEYKSLWQDTMEPFVVKNLENVQGDERDYIFISTLFGPNKDGNIMQRFGPINNPKGHRRLNVLFTRAKDGIELFTSLNSEDIKDSDKAVRGRSIFKKYLEYSRNQMLESGVETGKGTDSDFEDWVKAELELHGYKVTPQVGVSGFFIDLGIKHKDYPHGYLAGVECDGATYHSSLSARDNDIVRQKILESYGWNIYRIWSTNWFQDPEKELQKLINYLNGVKKSA